MSKVLRWIRDRGLFVAASLCQRLWGIEGVSKIVPTHSGFAIFGLEVIVKVSIHPRVATCNSNREMALDRLKGQLLPQIVKERAWPLVSVVTEVRYSTSEERLEFDELLRSYQALVAPTLDILKEISPTEFVGARASLIGKRGYSRFVERRLTEIMSKPGCLYSCVGHGDLWRENILKTTDGRVLFIDLERAAALSLPELDVLHLWVYEEMLSSMSRSWSAFETILRRVLYDGEAQQQVRAAWSRFYEFARLPAPSFEHSVLVEIVAIYLAIVICDNDFYLSGSRWLAWRRRSGSVRALCRELGE